jgi:hypothetical protein
MKVFYDYMKIGDYKMPIYTDDNMPNDEIAIANWQGIILNKVKIKLGKDPSMVDSACSINNND